MASNQQQRCVFVGNIPYDATEQQLIQICEEVGPVVSFRLVVDRETGKPKGYGFCEYKDEETALSARRNLKGYEINGRQLRVDFAENDKGSDRSRDQGRGGPGSSTNDTQRKNSAGLASAGDSTVQQHIGLPLAMTAASVMAGALGGPQSGGNLSQNSLQNQPILGHDPLTLHLAKISRRQLAQVISEMKLLATQNKEVARQLLLLCPQLPKALFQAQIMLGMVTPQMLQMPNIRQAPTTNSESSLQGGKVCQPQAIASFSGLPPLVPVSSSLVQNPILPPSQLPLHSEAHLPNFTQPVVVQQTKPPGISGGSVVAPMHPQLSDRTLTGLQKPIETSSRASQPSLLQHSVHIGHGISGNDSQLPISNIGPPLSVLSRPQLSNPDFQIAPSVYPGNFDTRTEIDMSTQVGDGTFICRSDRNVNIPPVPSDRDDAGDLVVHAAKLVKLNDGTSAPFSTTKVTLPIVTELGPSNSIGIGSAVLNQSSKAEQSQNLEKQLPQLELPPDIESALLEQVMNLTQEQLSSLAPEQQQQVIQLQQMFR
ncbi:hypothetical protein Dimus_005638 [Dionaea muscipula]